MKNVIRCGVCGLGRIGWRFHLPAIKHTEGMEATAVADPLQERADEAKSVYGVQHCFTDWHEMADAGVIDLAVLASPTIFHREQCEYFMSKGADVFCDKPMALTLEDAQVMAEAAKKYNKKLMIYQPHRLNGLTLKAQGEALRHDDKFAYAAVWEYKGEDVEPELTKEDLVYEFTHRAQRNYKD